jgi:hypothetical protein
MIIHANVVSNAKTSMIKYSLIIILIFFFEDLSLAQTKLITGQVTDYKTQEPISHVNVFFSSIIYDITDDKGKFDIKIERLTESDTLKVRFLNYYDLNFINIPNELDTILLNNIPLFDYFTGNDMTDFFCGTLDFKCKRARKINISQEKQRIQNYYSQQNRLISEYVFHFDNVEYHIEVANHCIDLNRKK